MSTTSGTGWVEASAGGETVTNAYNGEGLRVSKASGGKTWNYLYENDKIVLEKETAGGSPVTTKNVHGLNLVSRETSAGTASSAKAYYMYNGHHDVVRLVTASADLAIYYYDAFGVPLTEDETNLGGENPYRYSGYFWDSSSDLYYLKSRFYDPGLARFMTEDTFRGEANDALSLNLYTYVSNNPLVYWDPTGHAGETLQNLKSQRAAYKRDYDQGLCRATEKEIWLKKIAEFDAEIARLEKEQSSKNALTSSQKAGFKAGAGPFIASGAAKTPAKPSPAPAAKPTEKVSEKEAGSDSQTDLLRKLGDSSVSVYLEPGLSEKALDFLQKSMDKYGGELDLSLISLEATPESSAILGAVKKLTQLHGPSEYDEYLLDKMENIAAMNDHKLRESYVIDKAMLGYIGKLAREVQRDVDSNQPNSNKWQEENISSLAGMAQEVDYAVYLAFLYASAQSASNTPGNSSTKSPGYANGGSGSNNVPSKANDVVNHVESHNGAPPQGYKGGRTFNNQPVNGGQKLPDGVFHVLGCTQ